MPKLDNPTWKQKITNCWNKSTLNNIQSWEYFAAMSGWIFWHEKWCIYHKLVISILRVYSMKEFVSKKGNVPWICSCPTKRFPKQPFGNHPHSFFQGCSSGCWTKKRLPAQIWCAQSRCCANLSSCGWWNHHNEEWSLQWPGTPPRVSRNSI